MRDGTLQGASDAEDLGFAVRVLHRGAWGFASGVLLSDDEAAAVADRAVAVAQVAATMTREPVELAAEPTYDDVTWVSAYEVNPLEVPLAEKAALLVDWTRQLLSGAAVEHATASLQQVQENKFYADLTGTRTTQQRVRMQPGFEAMGTGTRHLRRHGQHRSPGRPWLGVLHRRPTGPGTGTPSSPRCPSCSPRSSPPLRSWPAPTTSWCTPRTCG